MSICGTRVRYIHGGCRCDECRTANSAYVRERRQRDRVEAAEETGKTERGIGYLRCGICDEPLAEHSLTGQCRPTLMEVISG